MTLSLDYLRHDYVCVLPAKRVANCTDWLLQNCVRQPQRYIIKRAEILLLCRLVIPSAKDHLIEKFLRSQKLLFTNYFHLDMSLTCHYSDMSNTEAYCIVQPWASEGRDP